mmetsp:Transcript_28717/g.92460  ORF Transcript_28717/g.92460 Transcript_28717/m.92460 type:complete len:229 (+) Transcript_28717:1196-1882(+)
MNRPEPTDGSYCSSAPAVSVKERAERVSGRGLSPWSPQAGKRLRRSDFVACRASRRSRAPRVAATVSRRSSCASPVGRFAASGSGGSSSTATPSNLATRLTRTSSASRATSSSSSSSGFSRPSREEDDKVFWFPANPRLAASSWSLSRRVVFRLLRRSELGGPAGRSRRASQSVSVGAARPVSSTQPPRRAGRTATRFATRSFRGRGASSKSREEERLFVVVKVVFGE